MRRLLPPVACRNSSLYSSRTLPVRLRRIVLSRLKSNRVSSDSIGSWVRWRLAAPGIERIGAFELVRVEAVQRDPKTKIMLVTGVGQIMRNMAKG